MKSATCTTYFVACRSQWGITSFNGLMVVCWFTMKTYAMQIHYYIFWIINNGRRVLERSRLWRMAIVGPAGTQHRIPTSKVRYLAVNSKIPKKRKDQAGKQVRTCTASWLHGLVRTLPMFTVDNNILIESVVRRLKLPEPVHRSILVGTVVLQNCVRRLRFEVPTTP